MRKLLCIVFCILMMKNMSVRAFAEESMPLPDDATAYEEPGGSKDNTGDNSHVHSYDIFISDTATCGAAGTATYACSCGDEMQSSSPATGNHSYSGMSYVDTTEHKRICSVCGNEDRGSHNWDSGQTVQEANCIQEGEQVFACSDCHGTYSRKLPKTGHHYDPGISDETYHVCSVCQSIQSHSWDDGEVTHRPTCSESGTFEYYCSICQMTLVEPLEKLTTHAYDSACDPNCNVCGAVRTIEHTFTTAWSKNYKGHWHECTKCGEQKDFAGHNPGPDATEDEEQVCLTCKYVITPKKNHVHKYEAQWSSDEVGHWHECSGCKSEKDYASHTYDDDCDSVCNVCSFEREDSHHFAENWQISNFEHWKICSQCGEESLREKHIPGPEATDEAAQVCTVCSFELMAKQEHTHEFGTDWNQTEDQHWQVCSCGEQSVPASHIWTAGEKGRNGVVVYTCTQCGLEKKVETTSSGFSATVIVLILLALVCVAGIAVLIIIMKRRGFGLDQPEEQSENLEEETEDRYL